MTTARPRHTLTADLAPELSRRWPPGSSGGRDIRDVRDEQQAGRAARPGRAPGRCPGRPRADDIPGHVDVALRSFGQPNSALRQFDFMDESYEWRRVFSELFGTFLLVLAAAGGGMVNARFGGHVTGSAALVVAPALTVTAIILFMGAVSGAHLNPAVSLAFALRGNFPWKRVPAYSVPRPPARRWQRC